MLSVVVVVSFAAVCVSCIVVPAAVAPERKLRMSQYRGRRLLVKVVAAGFLSVEVAVEL
jgi:hypothetical protein